MAWLQREHDCRLYYEVYGNKAETLVMLHGNGEDSTYFQNQIPYFINEYRVIVMDMRGHGKSSLGGKPLDFALFASDVKALLDELQIRKIHLLGFSDGGNTAMHVAIRYPQYLSSMILNGANRNTKGIKLHIQLPIVLGYGLLSLFPFAQCKAKKEVMGLMVNHPHITLEEVRHIHIPVLVLVGDRDMVKDAHSRELADALGNAQLQILHGSHFIAREHFEEYNQCVHAFLKKITTVL